MKDRKVGGRKYGVILHLPGVHLPQVGSPHVCCAPSLGAWLHLVSISFEGQDHSKK